MPNPNHCILSALWTGLVVEGHGQFFHKTSLIIDMTGYYPSLIVAMYWKVVQNCEEYLRP